VTLEEKAKLYVISAKLARIGFDLATGDREDAGTAAREIMALTVSMIPVDDLKGFLTETDRIFAELAADCAEQLKVGSSIP
jgi:hypothetical protein